MPSPPPITFGLSVWLCSDTNVDLKPDGSLVSWAAADGAGVRAVSIGSTRPQWLPGEINGYPMIRFSGTQGLFLETGMIAQDSFTLIAIGRATGSRAGGSPGLPGQKMLFYQDGSSALTHASVSLGVNGVGVYEFGTSEYPRAEAGADGACFCPLVVRYEGRSLNVYLSGSHIIGGTSAFSPQPVNAPHGIGGPGGVDGGFEGDIAEVLIYDRALTDWERQMVEQYLLSKYACGSSSSSDSSLSEDSSWSSEESSSSSLESSSESSWSSSEESSSSDSLSSSSDWWSSDSSWSSSEESSSSDSSSSSSEWWSSDWSSSEDSSSSSCSCEMPSDPVPVMEGLVAWQRSDLNVSTGANNEVGPWGAACACLPNALNATSSAPVLVPQYFGSWPAVQFTGTEGLRLDSAELGANSFTLVFVAYGAGVLPPGGNGPDGQRLLAAQDAATQPLVCANVALGYNGAAVFEFGGTSDYPRLEIPLGIGLMLPLVIRYENKELTIYGNGILQASSPVQPGYDIWIPRLIGADGSVVTGGFQGAVAEWLFYNRALSDYERNLVEQYVAARYPMVSSSESSSEESSASSSSSEESSWWSSAESSSEESSSESSSEESSSSSSSISYGPPPSSETSEESSQESSSEEESSSSSSSESESEGGDSSDDSSDSSSSDSSSVDLCAAKGPLIKLIINGPTAADIGDASLAGELGITHKTLLGALPGTPTFKLEEDSSFVGIVCVPSTIRIQAEMFYANTMQDCVRPGGTADITVETQDETKEHEQCHVNVSQAVAIQINNYYAQHVRQLKSLTHTSEQAAIAGITAMESEFAGKCRVWFTRVAEFFNDYHVGVLNGVFVGAIPHSYTPSGSATARMRWRHGVPNWYDGFDLGTAIAGWVPVEHDVTKNLPFSGQQIIIPGIKLPVPR